MNSTDKTSVDFSMLLAASVHDMKNSIGLMTHLIDELCDHSAGEPDSAGQLRFESARLNGYLVQLMALYRLENQQYNAHLTEIYLDEFIEDLALINQPVLSARGITIEQDVAAELCWTFDGSLVTGALSSIVTNLIRYVDGRLQACASRVRLSAKQEGAYLVLRVEDNGSGFPPSMLGTLQCADMGVDFIRGSTGFGLFFAGQVARQHCRDGRYGKIQLSNGGALGGGVFELFLP